MEEDKDRRLAGGAEAPLQGQSAVTGTVQESDTGQQKEDVSPAPATPAVATSAAMQPAADVAIGKPDRVAVKPQDVAGKAAPETARLPEDVKERPSQIVAGLADGTGDGAEAPAHGQKDGKPHPADYPEAVRGFKVGLIDGDERERRDAVAGFDDESSALRKWIERNKEETEPERLKREKRERSGKIISAVSDGLRALGNLFYTTRYAPNMYNHEKDSQLGTKNAAMERAKKERDKLHEQHLNFALKLGDLKNQRAATLQALKDRQQARKLAKEKADRDALLHPFIKSAKEAEALKLQNLARKAGHDADAAKVAADNAPKLQKKKIEAIEAQIQQRRAAAAASGRSNLKEFYAWDENGNVRSFKDKDAAEVFAKQHGTWKEMDLVSTTVTDKTDSRDKKTTQTATTTKTSGYPNKPQPDDNTPPSRRNNNDNTPPSRR